MRGITDFDISQPKLCNLVFSFVLQIDWLKPCVTDHAIACGGNGLASFICSIHLWCKTTIVATGRKVRFHHTLPFMTKQRGQFGCATFRWHKKSLDLWFYTPVARELRTFRRPTTWRIWSINIPINAPSFTAYLKSVGLETKDNYLRNTAIH